MNYSDIIDRVSNELNIPKNIVDKTYKAYWFYIRNYIQSLSLKNNISEESFTELRTCFNIPSIGKLYIPLNKFLKYKNIFNKHREKHIC